MRVPVKQIWNNGGGGHDHQPSAGSPVGASARAGRWTKEGLG